MGDFSAHGAAAKLEDALKVFRTTFANVESQWTDAARREFEETHLAPMEPHVKDMLAVIARLSAAVAAAEHDCGSNFGMSDE